MKNKIAYVQSYKEIWDFWGAMSHLYAVTHSQENILKNLTLILSFLNGDSLEYSFEYFDGGDEPFIPSFTEDLMALSDDTQKKLQDVNAQEFFNIIAEGSVCSVATVRKVFNHAKARKYLDWKVISKTKTQYFFKIKRSEFLEISKLAKERRQDLDNLCRLREEEPSNYKFKKEAEEAFNQKWEPIRKKNMKIRQFKSLGKRG